MDNESEIVKGKPLTKEETSVLLDLVEGSSIITSKKTNATNNKLKTAEWFRVTQRFNASITSSRRTPAQLRLKWENLKKNARKRSTKIQMNQIKTGGGPAQYIPPDVILDRVCGLLGSTAIGFNVPFGGDKEPDKQNYLNVGCSGDGDGGSSDGFGLASPNPSQVILQDGVLEPMSLDTNNFEIMSCGEGNGGGNIANVTSGDGNGGGGLASGCQVLHVIDANIRTPNKRKFTFSTPRVNKKLKMDDSKTARNQAIADYFVAKKQCLGQKLININLENDNLKLKNQELEFRNSKLLLEMEKLKLELDKLKQE